MQDKYFYMECDCGCSTIRFSKYEDLDAEIEEYGISYLKDCFMYESEGIFNLIKRRIKHSWYTLIGKEYYLFDIVLTKEQFEHMKKQIEEISK